MYTFENKPLKYVAVYGTISSNTTAPKTDCHTCKSDTAATNDGAQGEKMAKIKVLFPFIEAGFGHIMTEKSICDSFEKKYGDRVEVIRNDFYKNSGRAMANYEKMFTKSVKDFNIPERLDHDL